MVWFVERLWKWCVEIYNVKTVKTHTPTINRGTYDSEIPDI